MANELMCTSADVANTGGGSCDQHFNDAKGFIKVPASKVFTAAEEADIVSTIVAGIKSDVKALRFYPVSKIVGTEPSGGDAVNASLPNGYEVTVRRNPAKAKYQWYEGGMCLAKSIASWDTVNGNGDSAFIFFNEKQIMGANVGGRLAGIPMQNVLTETPISGTSSALAVYKVEFTYAAKYSLTDWKILNGLEITDTTFKGIDTINLEATSTLVAGVVSISARHLCSGIVNFAKTYSAQIVAGALWIVKNKVTGNLITITSVAYNATTENLLLTLSTADTDYPTTGNKLTVQLDVISALTTAGIPNAESNILTLTV